MNLEIIREDTTRLTRQRWRFWVSTDAGSSYINIVLDCFWRETRASVRHAYRYTFEDHYARLDSRIGGMPVHMVPQPDDVQLEARRQVAAACNVVVVDRRNVTAPWQVRPPAPSTEALRWEPMPQRRGDVEAFVDVGGLGRYLVRRTTKGNREFRAYLNGTPTAYRGSSDEVKAAVQRAVDQWRLTHD